jgi:hypothetical protein
MSSIACIKWIKIGSASFKPTFSVGLLLASSQVNCTNPYIASLIFLALDLVIGPSGTCKGFLRLSPPWFPSLNLLPNKSLYIDIDSIPPEWTNKNNLSYKFLPGYHFICLYASSINDSERFYNQIVPTNYKFSVMDIQRCIAHMYNIIQMRFQEGLIPRIIEQTPHMTICSEIRHGDISYPKPQL